MNDFTRQDLRDLREDLMAHLTVQSKQMLEGFDGLNKRLDELNGRTRTNAEDVAVLQSQMTDVRADKGWRSSLTSGGIVASIGIAVEYAIHRWWKG